MWEHFDFSPFHQASDEEVEKALNEALEAGYRHIDTAPVYLNEKTIGKVLKEWMDAGKVTRDELFIVTKLPPHGEIRRFQKKDIHRPKIIDCVSSLNIPLIGTRASTVEKFLKKSLDDLQLEFVDLYHVHVPFTVPEVDGPFLVEDGLIVLETTTDHVALWKVSQNFAPFKLICYELIGRMQRKTKGGVACQFNSIIVGDA